MKPQVYTINLYERDVKIVEHQGERYVDMSQLPLITGWPKATTDRFALHDPRVQGLERVRLPGRTGRYYTLDQAKEIRRLMSEPKRELKRIAKQKVSHTESVGEQVVEIEESN